jgi:hypothetical protein
MTFVTNTKGEDKERAILDSTSVQAHNERIYRTTRGKEIKN